MLIPRQKEQEIDALKSQIISFQVQNESLKIQTESLESKVTSFQAETECLKEQNEKLAKKLAWFEEQLKLSHARRFGKQSEQTHALQATLPLFDDNVSDEITETQEPVSAEKIKVTYERPKKNKPGRNLDTTHLPREQVLHDLSEHEKICSCGNTMCRAGEDKSETLELIPAQIKVIEHITPKYTCKACDIIKQSKKAENPIPKCMAGTSMIVDVMIKKYDHHLPLYRQSKILEQSNIDIPDNTLGNWVMGGAEILLPLKYALFEEIKHTTYLQGDETPVKVLYPDKKGYMWAYHSLAPGNKFIVFEFALTRAASVPAHRLKSFKGILQTDGYSGYEAIGKNSNITHIGCWDHARRKFVDTIKVSGNHAGIANQLLELINSLYDIERDIKEAAIEIRYKTRQEKSAPLLSEIFQIAKSIHALPKSTLGGAITYLKNNEGYLRKYIDDGSMQISNILVENQIRPFALGRKNWLFVGNETSANKSALLYSLIQSCKINNLDIRKYLTFVLNRAHDMRRGNCDPKSLLPQFITSEILNS